MDKKSFPGSFIWGTSTAAYQIEGSPLKDGAGPSIWHTFSHKKGKTFSGHTGDVACDHYNRYAEDVGHIKELGTKAYRFSVAWPRIVPRQGKVNDKGLDFYSRLTDSLLENGITPYITLFHWDTPQWMEDEGGVPSREVVKHFLFYTEAVFKKLGDRVKHWITINEPMVYTLLGYGTGEMAPGKKLALKDLFHAVHHLLFSHSEIVKQCRALVSGSQTGIAQAQMWIRPARKNRKKDRKSAEFMDALLNRLYIDPIILGKYPDKILHKFGKYFPKSFEQDLTSMKEPYDFTGINYYTKQDYRYAPFFPITQAREVRDPKARRSSMWEIYPEGLYNILMRMKNEYGNPPVIITENGYPLPEGNGPPLEDPERIDYLRNHLNMSHKAMSEGADLKGYFHWSLLDNFEWQHGYSMRFGLIHIDFKTLKRKWKNSAFWYRDLVTSGILS